MASNIAQTLNALAARAEELYRELVTTNAKFDELRRYTHESIAEYKRLLERLSDKIERIERDRIRAETELLGRIQALDARLEALSEQALHAAAEKAARAVMEEKLLLHSHEHRESKTEPKSLPDASKGDPRGT